jgi:hypothetical protein
MWDCVNNITLQFGQGGRVFPGCIGIRADRRKPAMDLGMPQFQRVLDMSSEPVHQDFWAGRIVEPFSMRSA